MTRIPNVEEMVDGYIEDTEEERPFDGMWHPSSMWHCARAAVLGVREVPTTNPPGIETKRVFRIGHIIHEFIQNAIEKFGSLKVFASEVEVDLPEWKLRGHADGLMTTGFGDEWVLEVKSTKSLRFVPKEDDEKQAATYAEALVKLGHNIAGIILVYWQKADGKIKEFAIPRKSSWLPMVERRIETLESYRDDAEPLPPALPYERGKPHWYTNYCSYKGSGLCCGDKDTDGEDW